MLQITFSYKLTKNQQQLQYTVLSWRKKNVQINISVVELESKQATILVYKNTLWYSHVHPQGAGSDTIREPFKVTSPTQHASR